MTRARRSLITAGAVAAALATWASDAAPAGSRADACASAAEDAQDLRSHGRLIGALARLRACMAPACPAIVRSDCARWQSEVDASVPTVVVSARSEDGRDLVRVRVTVDGSPFAETLDGLEKPLDPGAHHFHFETPGAPPVDADVVLREGEKRRAIVATFAAPRPRASGDVPASAPVPDRRADRGPWPWVLGGAGIVAMGVGAALTLFAESDLHGLQSGCGRAGTCTSTAVDPVRTRMWIGDVAIVAGAATLGVATWLAVRPVPGGAVVRLQAALP